MMESQGQHKWGVNRCWLMVCGLIMLVMMIAACDAQTPGQDSTRSQTGQVVDNGAGHPGEQKTVRTASLTENAGKCAECHAMAPEIATWQLSAHNKFECTVCHEVNVADYKNKTPNLPIKMKATIAADTCKQCHSTNRIYSPSGDLRIPHDKHDNAGIACVNCHKGVAHANIAEREITKQEGFNDLSKWTVKTAEKIVTKYYTQPNMWTCISCHKSLGKSRECSACHTKITSLPSHETGNWLVAHGKTGRKGIGECTKCHSIPGEEKFVVPSTGDKAVDFARANKFCYSCHTVRPEFHSNNMLSEHPALAVGRGVDNCWTCHSKAKPKPNANVAATYCNQCHWFDTEPPAVFPTTSAEEKSVPSNG